MYAYLYTPGFRPQARGSVSFPDRCRTPTASPKQNIRTSNSQYQFAFKEVTAAYQVKPITLEVNTRVRTVHTRTKARGECRSTRDAACIGVNVHDGKRVALLSVVGDINNEPWNRCA